MLSCARITLFVLALVWFADGAETAFLALQLTGHLR
jgi:hypothetical protein